MARKRMIDPSLWTDEGMADLTPRQQLLYIGLFSNADDDGRLKASLPAISLMLPTVYNGIDRSDIQADLDTVCQTMRQLRRYEANGRPYLVFQNYRQWQKIDKPSPSILPDPPETNVDIDPEQEPFVEESESAPIPVVPNRIEEKGIEEKGSDADAPAKAKRASQVSKDFAVTEALLAWGTDNGFTAQQMTAQVPEFIDHFQSKGETRKDWEASFHNWMRRARKWNQLDPTKPNNGDTAWQVINGGQSTGFDPHRTLTPEAQAEYKRRYDQGKAEAEAIERERQARAS